MIRVDSLSQKWPIFPLGECADFLDHLRRPVKSNLRKEGPYPYYGANGQQGTIDNYLFDEDLVLLAEDGGFFGQEGRTIAYRISGKTWVNNHAHVLRPKKGFCVDFLCKILEYYDVTPFITGTTRAKLNKSDALRISIPRPPLDEQRRIAAILDKADAIHRKRREALKLADDLVKSQFIEMFGDPVTNPMGWEVKRLGELGELNRGVSKHRPRNASELLGGDYPLIQTGEIAAADLYLTNYTSTYSEIGLRQSKMWPKGTLCITIAANIAKTAILNFDACFPDSVVGFISGEHTNQLFIHFWFSFFQKILEELAPESAQKNINLQTLRELKVTVPPLDLQNRFAAFVEQADKSKFAMQRQLAEVEAAKNALMQEYFQ